MRSTIALTACVCGLAIASLGFAQHGGEPQPRKPPPIARADRPPAADGQLELIAEFSETPGNVAVTPQGRVFVSMHPFGASPWKVMEVLAEGGLRPYPSPEWAKPVGANGVGIQSIIGIRSDRDGVLWMLDAGNLNEPNGTPPKLVAWDTKTDRLLRVIHIPPPASNAASFLQDFAIDSVREAIYIADCGIGAGFEATKPALMVVYLKSGASRRVLENAECVRAEPGATMTIDGVDVSAIGSDGKPLRPLVGVNPITIDDQNEWVTFGAMHGKTLWRVRAADLAAPGINDAMLAERVERLGEKSLSDGISIDSTGNVYVTEVQSHAIGVLPVGGTYRTHIADPRLAWPDGISAGPDGHFYVTVNQLNRHPALNASSGVAVDATKPPFQLYRFKPIAPATVGR